MISSFVIPRFLKNLIACSLISEVSNGSDKDLYSYGGRVLNIVVTSNTFENSRKKALEILDKINWGNGFYRKDIGYNVINT